MSDEKETEFERGAMWALELMRRHIEARRQAMRDASRKECGGADGILGATAHLLDGVRTEIEIEFVKTVRKAEGA